ncbi:MAG: hypothetical protein JXR80_03980 [Deltaproteobacteria bacterium]|nr:hypothetical protein [Deltaproteobacteria bacterium]
MHRNSHGPLVLPAQPVKCFLVHVFGLEQRGFNGADTELVAELEFLSKVPVKAALLAALVNKIIAGSASVTVHP